VPLWGFLKIFLPPKSESHTKASDPVVKQKNGKEEERRRGRRSMRGEDSDKGTRN
jgi:hypothetical protein